MKHQHCVLAVIADIICKCSGVSQQRRKSLPSPESSQDEDPFKFPRTQVLHFGNICPGDAPLPMRPYHAIIEGTDKWVHSFLFLQGTKLPFVNQEWRSGENCEAITWANLWNKAEESKHIFFFKQYDSFRLSTKNTMCALGTRTP